MISKRDLLNRLKRLKEEPDARVPICLVLDISGSMIGEPIEKLNEGISAFYSAIKEDDVNLGELELGKDLVYGMLIQKVEDEYHFIEVVYHDGGETTTSWASQIDDAGILTRELERLVMQFGE